MTKNAYDNLMLGVMALLFAICAYLLSGWALFRPDPEQEDLDARLPATNCQYVGCGKPQQKLEKVQVVAGYARRGGGTYVRTNTYALCADHLQTEAANRWPLAAWWRWLMGLGMLVVASGVIAMTGAVVLVHVPLNAKGLVPNEQAATPDSPPS